MTVLASFDSFNSRRYSKPWVATISNGKYDFRGNVGYYTGNAYKGNGEAGDIIVNNPQEGIIYAYGQKDNRGGNTHIYYATWDGQQFVDCDKAGRPLQA